MKYIKRKSMYFLHTSRIYFWAFALFVEPDALVVKFSRARKSLSNKMRSVARKLTKFSQYCQAPSLLLKWNSNWRVFWQTFAYCWYVFKASQFVTKAAPYSLVCAWLARLFQVVLCCCAALQTSVISHNPLHVVRIHTLLYFQHWVIQW